MGPGGEIAVVGMAGMFPGAKNIDEFWENLKNRVESVTFFSAEELEKAGIDSEIILDPQFIGAKGVLENLEYFDASFFGYSPREAEKMDPQLRILLELVWNALENAGYDSLSYEGIIGLFVGNSVNHFQQNQVARKLNLKVFNSKWQPVCSNSLAAIHLACHSLLTGPCSMALAGGVSISLPPKTGYIYQEGRINSADGHCKAFDAAARGTSGGDAAGIVVLKKLEQAVADRDCIHAVIKGSSLNYYGRGQGIDTIPGLEKQIDVIARAFNRAQVDPESIGYVETNGIGTLKADSTEIDALTRVFNSKKKAFCAIGSVKTNIGHVDIAAGAASFIKTVLVLKNKLIPPSLNFEVSAPGIPFIDTPFYVNTSLSQLEKEKNPMRAGVSSFGSNGINAHVILEEAPGIHNSDQGRMWKMIMLSARTPTSLNRITENLAEYLKKNPELNLADVAYTLQVGRRAFQHRKMVLCLSIDQAIEALCESGGDFFRCAPTKQKPASSFHKIGRLWLQGSNIDWNAFYKKEKRYRVSLPTYAFEKQAFNGFKPGIFRSMALDMKDLLDEKDIPPIKQQETNWLKKVEEGIPGVLNTTDYKGADMNPGENTAAVTTMRDRVKSERIYIAAHQKEKEKKYWLNKLKLSGEFKKSCFPYDYKKNGNKPQFKTLLFEFSREFFTRFMEISKDSPYTMNIILQAGLIALLGKYSNRTDIIIGSPIFKQDLAGDYINSVLVLRNHPEENLTFKNFLVQVRQTLIEATENENYPVELLPPQLGMPFSPLDDFPLFDVSILLPDIHDKEYLRHINHNMMFSFKRNGQFLKGTVKYNSLRFNQTTVKQVTDHFTQLLRKALFHLNFSLSDLEILSQDEKERILIQFKKTGADYLPQPDVKKEEEFIPPENEIQEKLAEIWGEVLEIEKDTISINKDFFKLGGDSLNITVLAAKIQSQFNVNIPLVEIFNIPTIKSLSRYIRDAETGTFVTKDDKLVLLTPGLNSPHHLFFIHDITGEVDGYFEFCKHLSHDFNCWGLRADRLQGLAPQNRTIREISQSYIEKIKTLQPHGPYYIAGWSFGGTISFEMARQLEQANEKIGFLALIDAYHPLGTIPRKPPQFSIESELNYVKPYLTGSKIIEKLKNVTHFTQVWSLLEDYLHTEHHDIEIIKKAVYQYGMQALPNYHNLITKESIYYMNVGRTFNNARASYRPPGKINNRGFFFKAKESIFNKNTWQSYFNSPLQSHEINGDHFSIFKMPYVLEFAKTFNKILIQKLDTT
jgi:thioesterase domain-containing protein/3-oxoacyl-(acyl-carrier-protein) synthase/acyl carrier protein